MTKKELIQKIAVANKTTITAAESFYHAFEKVLIAAITSHGKVILSPTIGKFILKSRKAHIGRNPQTGKKLKIPARTVVTFKLSQTIKEKVKPLILK
ncbi:MAG: HU family DNA-binding protein ['Waltheria sp.' little leaf phytoplasma]|nr:HU family DNA-binding protein ['Waltheria sp.' little leaf phytoplasma]